MSKEKMEKIASQVAEMQNNGVLASEIIKSLDLTYAEYKKITSLNNSNNK